MVDKIRTQALPEHLRPLFNTTFITPSQIQTLVLLRVLTEYDAWTLLNDVPF